jgi:hypothetical protein
LIEQQIARPLWRAILYQPALDLELIEQVIALFKQEIPWDFQE